MTCLPFSMLLVVGWRKKAYNDVDEQDLHTKSTRPWDPLMEFVSKKTLRMASRKALQCLCCSLVLGLFDGKAWQIKGFKPSSCSIDACRRDPKLRLLPPRKFQDLRICRPGEAAPGAL